MRLTSYIDGTAPVEAVSGGIIESAKTVDSRVGRRSGHADNDLEGPEAGGGSRVNVRAIADQK
jgi:hypothetical protein